MAPSYRVVQHDGAITFTAAHLLSRHRTVLLRQNLIGFVVKGLRSLFRCDLMEHHWV
jgi:hypothetical protein